HRMHVALYVIALIVYGAASHQRLLHQSRAPHYVYLADAMLHRRLALAQDPPSDDDWARVDSLVLRDGRHLRGQFAVRPPNTFLTTRGQRVEVPPEEIAGRHTQWYVSFPPFPALVIMPVVAVAGTRANDVVFTLLLAALLPPLGFGLLGMLRAR